MTEPMISPALRRTVNERGDEAARWLAGVPALIDRLAVSWELEVGPAIEHGGCASILLPVTTARGQVAVLKLSVPHEEARHEGGALRAWDGRGAVALFRVSDDGFSLLLERCQPGYDLWAVPIAEQVDVLAALLPRLWLPEPPIGLPQVKDTAAAWEQQLGVDAAALGLPRSVADRARSWCRELPVDAPAFLLHGDLHPGNVLASAREPWLAIDPKPWVGDPAFDLAQVLLNWARIDLGGPGGSPGAIRALAWTLAERLSLDPIRLLRWAVVKGIGWRFGRDEVLLLDQAAR